MAFDRDLVRGSLDLMVLSVLAEGPKYGYLIQRNIREASGDEVKLPGGTLYPLLHRLEGAGAVQAERREEGGVSRRWYELTPKGRKLLEERTRQWDGLAGLIRRLVPGSTPDGDAPPECAT